MRQLVFAVLLAGSPATAEGWFQHNSGELRAFHKDWIAACANEGAGQCRVVRASADPGSTAYFDMRLAAYRLDNSPNWVVEIMDRYMPASDLETINLQFGKDSMVLKAGDWGKGDFEFGSASDTITVRDPDLALDIVSRMKKSMKVTLKYAPIGQGDGSAEFSLRGVTAAMNAIEARVLSRQE